MERLDGGAIDFWIGRWNCHFEGGHAVNTVDREHSGAVLAGSYWAFVGVLVDGDPAFATPEPVDAHRLYKRMVFSNIRDDGFDRRWASSPDQLDWTRNWAITYTRLD